MRSPDKNSPKFSLAEKTFLGLQNWNCAGNSRRRRRRGRALDAVAALSTGGTRGATRRRRRARGSRRGEGESFTYPVVLVRDLRLRRREAVDLEPDALAGLVVVRRNAREQEGPRRGGEGHGFDQRRNHFVFARATRLGLRGNSLRGAVGLARVTSRPNAFVPRSSGPMPK